MSDEAKEEDTTTAAEPSDDAESSFTPFDETSEAFSPSEIRKATGADGLPTQVASPGSGMSDIPSLSTETLVCMGDFSKFVTRDDFGKIIKEWETARQDTQGLWWGDDLDAHNNYRKTEVEPLRPPCKHYVRQVTQFDKNPEAKDHLRLCSARRTTEGTFMSLKDIGMWACSMRSPRDPESEKLITEFDLLKMQQGRTRELYSIKGKEES